MEAAEAVAEALHLMSEVEAVERVLLLTAEEALDGMKRAVAAAEEGYCESEVESVLLKSLGEVEAEEELTVCLSLGAAVVRVLGSEEAAAALKVRGFL